MLAVTLNSKVLAADQGSEKEPANHAGAPDPLLQLHQLTPTHLWRVTSGGGAAPTPAVPGAESGRKHANALPLETADDAAGFLAGCGGPESAHSSLWGALAEALWSRPPEASARTLQRWTDVHVSEWRQLAGWSRDKEPVKRSPD